MQNGFNDAASPAVLYGRRWNGTAGLVWHYYGGCMKLGTTFTQIANGSVSLTASSTNYIEADATTGVSDGQHVGFTAGRIPLYQVVTSSSAVTSYTDSRALTYAGPAGVGNYRSSRRHHRLWAQGCGLVASGEPCGRHDDRRLSIIDRSRPLTRILQHRQIVLSESSRNTAGY